MSKFMADDEIRALYRDAQDKKKQISILAQLNLCDKAEIEKIVNVEKENTEMARLHYPADTEAFTERISEPEDKSVGIIADVSHTAEKEMPAAAETDTDISADKIPTTESLHPVDDFVKSPPVPVMPKAEYPFITEYPFSVIDAISKGKMVYYLDKLSIDCGQLNQAPTAFVLKLLKHAEQERERYYFWSVENDVSV